MKIVFECKDIPDLKLQIQEYAISHLGLSFAEMSKSLIPGPGSQTGVPQYSPTQSPPVIKRRPGRQPGFKVRKDTEPEVSTESLAPTTPDETPISDEPQNSIPSDPAVDTSGSSYTKDAAKQMITAVHMRFLDSLGREGAMAKAVACLEKFGAKHLNDLKEEQYRLFIEHCQVVTRGG